MDRTSGVFSAKPSSPRGILLVAVFGLSEFVAFALELSAFSLDLASDEAAFGSEELVLPSAADKLSFESDFDSKTQEMVKR